MHLRKKDEITKKERVEGRRKRGGDKGRKREHRKEQ